LVGIFAEGDDRVRAGAGVGPGRRGTVLAGAAKLREVVDLHRGERRWPWWCRFVRSRLSRTEQFAAMWFGPKGFASVV
jgi:hypothetical protein